MLGGEASKRTLRDRARKRDIRRCCAVSVGSSRAGRGARSTRPLDSSPSPPAPGSTIVDTSCALRLVTDHATPERTIMSVEDIRRVTIDQVTLLGQDREQVMRSAITKARTHLAGGSGAMVLRMHPEAHDRFIPDHDTSTAVSRADDPLTIVYRCNVDQDLGQLSLSLHEVEGDQRCADLGTR